MRLLQLYEFEIQPEGAFQLKPLLEYLTFHLGRKNIILCYAEVHLGM